MLNPSKGISAFVDNLIVISAARYGAQIADESNTDQEKWHLVAQAVQSVLLHPHNEDERLMLRHIEVSKFSAEVCHHRAAYLLWKAKRSEASAQRPSTFNITRDSIADEIGLLYKSVKQNLPTISLDIDDSGHEEEIHQFAVKSEEDVRRDQRLAEAEDDFMRSVQELQTEFYAKHKKWVEVPINLSPSKSSAAVSTAAVPAKARLEELDTNGVAQLLDELDVSEHKQSFRRTTGKLLAEISKADLRERFGGDKEAADILWAHIEKSRSAKSGGASAATPPRDAVKSAEQQQAERLFAAFRSPDPFASLKKAMNPDRPLRPSEQSGEVFSTELERYSKATAGAAPTAPATQQPTIGNKPAAQKATESSPPNRGNRWQVVEYDDDDEDEEDS